VLDGIGSIIAQPYPQPLDPLRILFLSPFLAISTRTMRPQGPTTTNGGRPRSRAPRRETKAPMARGISPISGSVFNASKDLAMTATAAWRSTYH
jgi:hypothetical protein